MINRTLTESIRSKFFAGKAILLIGSRQVGKTTLIQSILEGEPSSDVLILDGDDHAVVKLLEDANTNRLRMILGKHRFIFIDEAQRIPNLSLKAKIIVDKFKDKQLIISGSSAFEINQQMQEPLTGRKWTYYLWPLSWREYENHVGMLQSELALENRLIYGFYPDVINNELDEARVLKELTTSYLYKDVLMFGNLKKPVLIEKILRALAYQIGSEVKYTEVAELVGADPKTVSHYIDVLEKTCVIFKLAAFSRNLRNEIKQNQKIYFHDNGVRNAVIDQLENLSLRSDVGALWENFLISERYKTRSYSGQVFKGYFWRTKQQQEVDYVEENGGSVHGYEIKWNPNKKVRFPATFTKTYKSENTVVNRENFRDFI